MIIVYNREWMTTSDKRSSTAGHLNIYTYRIYLSNCLFITDRVILVIHWFIKMSMCNIIIFLLIDVNFLISDNHWLCFFIYDFIFHWDDVLLCDNYQSGAVLLFYIFTFISNPLGTFFNASFFLWRHNFIFLY